MIAMVRTSRMSTAMSALVVLLLLLTTLSPALAAAPSPDGDDGTGSSGESRDSASDGEDDEETIPLYTLIDGPQNRSGFGQCLANLGDVDDDGLPDLLVGSGYDMWIEPYPIPPYYGGAYLLPGRTDRDFMTSQLQEITNTSSIWNYESERWAGDLDGDGHADMVSDTENYGIRDGTYEDDEEVVPWYNNFMIQVRYGTEGGLPDDPDLLIDIRPEGAPDTIWFSFQYGGVGDVNGDGYDDLFVFRNQVTWYDEIIPPGGRDDEGRGSSGGSSDEDPTDPDEPKPDPDPYPEPNRHWIPAEMRLYYGSADGLSAEHDWNASLKDDSDIWYAQGVYHADVNGDDHQDVILASTSAPHIRIHHGSSDGLSVEPDRAISFSQQFSYGWSLHSPVDYDGDGFDDLVVDYGQQEGLFKYVQYTYVFTGSEVGIGTVPNHEFKLDSRENAQVVMTDVNGDGLHDVFIVARKTDGWEDTSVDVILQLHFNTGDGFPDKPSWQRELEDIKGSGSSGMSVGGDFDGDGMGDVALGITGSQVFKRPDGQMIITKGRVMIVYGAAIMDLLRPISLKEGPTLYAGLKAYDFLVNANPTGLNVTIYGVTLTLGPGTTSVELTWDSMIDSLDTFFETSDPDGLVELTSTAGDAVWDPENNTVWLHFRIVFDWDWPDEGLYDVKLTYSTSSATGTGAYIESDLFSVENDLDFAGPLLATGSVQGELEEGDWVQGGEDVTLHGPKVVYEGTEDLYPPGDVGQVVLQDNDGDYVLADIVPGDEVELTITADAYTDLDESLTLSMQDLPFNASVASQPEFRIRVDGDEPVFANPVPGPEDWHSSTQVLVSITADDTGTSGVEASKLQYSYSVDGGLTWSDWSRSGLETTSSDETVDGLVLIDLPDGDDNYVRWRAMDLVGNGWAVSEGYLVKVDTINVTYSDAFPSDDDWQTSLEVLCGLTIKDEDGAGIDVSTVQYRISTHNLSGYGDWQDWDEGSAVDATSVDVEALLTLGESPYNYFQWRAVDIAGNGYTTSPHYRVRVDATPIAFSDFAPLDEPQATSEVTVAINVSDGPLGSGVDMASIQYSYTTDGSEWTEWASAGMTGVKADARFTRVFTLPDGDANQVRFRGRDVAGNPWSQSEEYAIVVDTTGPLFGEVSPGADEKQAGTSVTVTVTLSDAVTGVDVTTVQYSVRLDGEGAFGDWMAVTPTDSGGDLVVQVALDLVRGEDNQVRFRAADLLGNEVESAPSSIWVNRFPSAAIESPVSTVTYREDEPVALSANGSADPDGDELNYTWRVSGSQEVLAHGREALANLEPGTYNLTLTVRDDSGAEDEVEVEVTVEALTPPSTAEGGTVMWVMLLIIVIIVAVAALAYMHSRRRALVEFEPVPQ